MSSTELTIRYVSLGDRDSVTGWCAKEWDEQTIDGSIQNAGSSKLAFALGTYPKYPHTAYIPDVVRIGDELIDAFSQYYSVDTTEQVAWNNQFDHYMCKCTKLVEHSDREATSGIWHLDSDILKTDSRYRHKLYFETYVNNNNVELDDGITNASIVYMFAGADYPLLLELLPGGNDVDVAVTIHDPVETARTTHNHYPYGFDGTIEIELWSMNKAGLTAVNLLNQMEEEIKHVITDHATGILGQTIRGIERVEDGGERVGDYTLYSRKIVLKYTRSNDDYVATVPSITWGPSAAPTGTFIFPNCTKISYPNSIADIKLLPPGRVGNIK